MGKDKIWPPPLPNPWIDRHLNLHKYRNYFAHIYQSQKIVSKSDKGCRFRLRATSRIRLFCLRGYFWVHKIIHSHANMLKDELSRKDVLFGVIKSTFKLWIPFSLENHHLWTFNVGQYNILASNWRYLDRKAIKFATWIDKLGSGISNMWVNALSVLASGEQLITQELIVAESSNLVEELITWSGMYDHFPKSKDQRSTS